MMPHAVTLNDAIAHSDTAFVRFLNALFRLLGKWTSEYPVSFILASVLSTVIASSSIPFTKMTNDVTDFTPLAAKARSELRIYESFFSRAGEPIAIFVLISGRNERTMLGVNQLNDAVNLLDGITNEVRLQESARNASRPFSEFCTNFCELNEPIRNFKKGLEVNTGGSNESYSSVIDLAYPTTTVIGRKLYMDANFFGLLIEVFGEDGERRTITLNELITLDGASLLDDQDAHVANNVRDVRLVVLQLRAEKPAASTAEDVERYEMAVVNYVRNFSSKWVTAVVQTPSYVTSEIVRAGLTMLPFIGLGFAVMCVFSSFTASISALFMNQMSVSKVILAILACVCPFMAVGTALGLLFWLGFRFGSILCVTPFLVLAIGVDDAFLMISSWQRIAATFREYPNYDRKGEEKNVQVAVRIATMLEDIGPSVTITTLTNVLAFAIGALTPTPEIRLFCIGSGLAMIFDFIYQITFFGAAMALLARKEKFFDIHAQKELRRCTNFLEVFRESVKSFMITYCSILCRTMTSIFVICGLIIYWCISLYGAVNMKAELRPEKLFLDDSDMLKVLELKNEFITPYYATCFVFVNNPGDIESASDLKMLHLLVESFERLPRSLGRFSTKFWLRDYEEFVQTSRDSPTDDSREDEQTVEVISSEMGAFPRNESDLSKFLEWPEFRFWRGFLDFRYDQRNRVVLKKFFFTTAAHGEELREWSNRAELMRQWRDVADQYKELEVSVYEDDAKFLDLIGTLNSQTLQSTLCTLSCMLVVCFVFIPKRSAILVTGFSIVSVCIGVFGFLCLWDVELDPVAMSSFIMSIGFSVDIPAHITYHFSKAPGSTVESKLVHCLCAVTFPVFQAALSTLLCISTILCVQIHMGNVFVKTMFLVVSIGLVHGLVVIPVLLNVTSVLFLRRISRTSTASARSSLSVHTVSCNVEHKS